MHTGVCCSPSCGSPPRCLPGHSTLCGGKAWCSSETRRRQRAPVGAENPPSTALHLDCKAEWYSCEVAFQNLCRSSMQLGEWRQVPVQLAFHLPKHQRPTSQ